MFEQLITEVRAWWVSLPPGTCITTIIATSAMLATIGQWHIQRKHNRLMVRPKLDGDTMVHWGANEVRFTVTNNGAGPAIVKAITILVDGKRIESNSPLIDAIKIIFPGIPEHLYGHTEVQLGSYIRPSQTVQVLTIISELQEARENIVRQVHSRAQLLVEYDSIYEEHFNYDSRAG